MSVPLEGWGRMVEETINYGREDRSSSFKKISQNDPNFEEFDHTSHIMVYSKTAGVGILNFPLKAHILMELKFDGSLGFPGGFVDEGETPVESVRRELKEEKFWCGVEERISDSDYLFSHLDENKEVVMHFFATEICEAKVKEIEKKLTLSPAYGTEVLGLTRVPLYIMGDSFRGFPAFLRNHFYGNAKLQLIETVCQLKFLSEEQIIQALYSAPNITE